MSRTFTNLLTHLIFSTKHREPMIVPEIESELHSYLGGCNVRRDPQLTLWATDIAARFRGLVGWCN